MNKLRKYGIILTTIITIISSSLIVTKADTMPVIQSVHEFYVPFPATSPNAYACRGVISINFDNYVTGTLTTNIVADDYIVLNFNNYVDFYCIGAEATVTANETRITFHIEDEKTILLYYVSTYVATGTGVTLGELSVDLSYKSKTLDVISHVDATDVNQISGQMATLLSTMNNIYDQDTTILSRLTTLNTKTDTIISMLGDLSTISSTLNTISDAVTDLDNKLDTISWIDETENYSLTWCNTINGTYGTTQLNNKNDIYFKITVNTQPTPSGDYIRKILIPGGFAQPGVNDDYEITLYNMTPVESSYSLIEQPTTYYNKRALRYFEVYIQSYIGTTSNASMTYTIIHVHCESPRLRTYTLEEFPLYVFKLGSNDIEYWQLLQTFNQFQYQTKQLDLTQNLIDIVSQLTSSNSTETTENITNFNTNMEIINNIETELSVDFGTYNTEFQTQNNGNWLVSPTASGTYQQYKTLFTEVKDQVKIATMPLSLIMLCAVLLALLG